LRTTASFPHFFRVSDRDNYWIVYWFKMG
jgi:hypothetical protein